MDLENTADGLNGKIAKQEQPQVVLQSCCGCCSMLIPVLIDTHQWSKVWPHTSGFMVFLSLSLKASKH